MGLLDSLFAGGPGQQGLLAGSAALLNAGGPSRMPISFGQGVAQALTAGQGAYADAQTQMLKKQMQDLQLKQLQEAQRDRELKAQEAEKRRQILEQMNPTNAGPVPQPQLDAYNLMRIGELPAKDYLSMSNPESGGNLVPVGPNVFDKTKREWITPPEGKPRAVAPPAIVQAINLAHGEGTPAAMKALQDYVRKETGGGGGGGGGTGSVIDAGGTTQFNLTKKFGKPPAGYRWRDDGSQEAIPGGPADIKAGAQADKDKQRTSILAEQAKSVLDTVKEAKALVGWNTAGVAGLASAVPMTDARKLAGAVDTIKANLGFDRLQQMRDMSPTGGALGQVAVQEINYLQSTVAKLDQLQRPKDILSALNKIEQHYKKWASTLGVQPEGDWGDAEQAPAPTATNPQTGEKLILKDGKWVPMK